MNEEQPNHNLNIELAKECWNYYNKNLFSEINSLHVEALQSLSMEEVDKWLTGELTFYNNVGEINSAKVFNDYEKGQIKKLYSQIMDPDFINNLLNMAIEKNEILIDSLFGNEKASSKQSIYLPVHMGRNFLRFIDGNESFYIIQRFSFTGIYFPARKTVFEITGKKYRNKNLKKHVQQLNRETVRIFDKIVTFLKSINRVSLYGLLVSCQRPYHYFRDFLPIIHNFRHVSGLNINKPDPFGKIPKIISFEDGMFYSIKNLYSLPCVEQVVDKTDLNEILYNNYGFIIQPSSNNRHYSEKLLSDLSNLLISKSIERLLEQQKERHNFEKLKDCFPILWFGICGEKRSWIEKAEGIQKIVREVHKLYPNVGIVLDGLTSTEAQNEKQFRKKSAREDAEAAKQILNRIDPSIPSFNLIGSTSKKKIAYASQIDFFLTSYSTDTMYVAHVCGKHGVAHLNTIKNINLHKHPSIYKIPDKYVKNILVDKNKNEGPNVSYSVDPEVVCTIFMKKLKKSLSKNRK